MMNLPNGLMTGWYVPPCPVLRCSSIHGSQVRGCFIQWSDVFAKFTDLVSLIQAWYAMYPYASGLIQYVHKWLLSQLCIGLCLMIVLSSLWLFFSISSVWPIFSGYLFAQTVTKHFAFTLGVLPSLLEVARGKLLLYKVEKLRNRHCHSIQHGVA